MFASQWSHWTVVDLQHASSRDLFRSLILFSQYKSCDDTQETIFFQSRTFSGSHAVFFTNTTRFEPPRHRHMICIRKTIDVANCSAKFVSSAVRCCNVGFLTRSLCGSQRPVLISSCCISWTRASTLLEFRLCCDYFYDPGIGLRARLINS